MRLNGKWLIVLCVLAVLPLSGCGFMQKLQARDNLNKGVKAFTDQKYDTAAQYFKKSLQLDPEFESARMYLATAYTYQYIPGSTDEKNLEMADKAIKIFKEVIAKAKDPSKPNQNAMLSLATLYYHLEDFDKSKEWCNKVLKVYPNNAEAYYRIAVMDYNDASEKTGSKGEFIEDLTPEDKAKIQANIDEGIAVLEKALVIRPEYPDALRYENLLLREKAKFEKDPAAKSALTQRADELFLKAIEVQRKLQEVEAKKALNLKGKEE
jgi:tetratricopeptide (TPR) repeat protein